MHATIDDVAVYYTEHGKRHAGVGVARLRTLLTKKSKGSLNHCFGDRPGFRRIYLDLPGMGDTPAPARICSSNDVIEVVLGFVDAVIGDEAFLVVGHSAGGYLARGVDEPPPPPSRRIGVDLPSDGRRIV